MNKCTQKIMLILSLTFACTLRAHEGIDHSAEKISEKSEVDDKEVIFKRINDEYLKSIKPIFTKSCMDCHGQETKYPWYYSTPGAKQLIDHDIKESKKHLDMSKDFPFISHATPVQDLAAIWSSIEKGSMPPKRYRMLNKTSEISAEELKIIEAWVKKGVEALSNKEAKN